MRNSRIVLVYLLLIVSSVVAQNKLFTLEEAVLQPRKFFPTGISQLQWIPGEDEYSYIEEVDNNMYLMRGYAKSSEKERIIQLSSLKNKIKDEDRKEIKSFPRIRWIDENNFTFSEGRAIFKYNINSDKLELENVIPENAKDIDIQEDKYYIAFTRENNLYIALRKDNIRQITFEDNKDIVNGQAVHRREFGINKGTFWSPNGNYLAFYRMDETMVTDYPIIDIEKRPAEVRNIKYPMAGETSHQVKIGVYGINSGKTIWLKTGEPLDQYLTNVTWTPDEKYILVAHLNRDQNHLKMIKYDIFTGKPVKILFEEKHNKYVEPSHKPVFLKNDINKFIWFSRQDGWNHLYLYDTESNMIRQLTKGEWEVTSLDGFDKDCKNIFFTATIQSPIERHFYSLNLRSGKITKFTQGSGTHNVSPNTEGRYFIDHFRSINTPHIISIFDKKGKIVRTLHKAENPIEEYKTGEYKIFTVETENNVKLYCSMHLPPDFDSKKKYPVLVYVYGGPHSQLVRDTWQSNLWFYYLTQRDFIVFTVDNRGTGYRGREFEQATFRNLGTSEVQDQIAAIDYLKTLPYVDSGKIGVFGWSYGGFMTCSMMTREPETFKAGVAGAPVTDWKYYEVMYTERYMDTPQNNKEGYEKASVLNYIENLKGNLLIIHGTYDDIVMWQNTLMLLKKAIDNNIQLEYFVYPGHRHGIYGKDRLHLYRKITDFFMEHLK